MIFNSGNSITRSGGWPGQRRTTRFSGWPFIIGLLVMAASAACRTNLIQADGVSPRQTPEPVSPVGFDKGPFVCVSETQPQFPGGMKALVAYVQHNTNYPEAARQAHITGRVFVSFILDTAGFRSGIRVLKGLGYGCDEEAIRIIDNMPAPWKPATQSGHAVAVRYHIPVFFPPKPPDQSR